jgi:cytochrome c biogenesis protein CcmG, thiol:disulfide interchange protein DsbE
MHLRVVLVALVVLAVGACATPRRGTEPPAAAATTTAAKATAAPKKAAKAPPPGIVPVERRQPAPALRVTAFDGRTVTLDDFRGKPLVVQFFESWCSTCRIEQPDLSRVGAELAGRVGFVGVSYHDTTAAGRDYQRRFGVPYPLANDPTGRTWAAWHVPYQPVVVLVDTQGRIAERIDGGTTGGTLRAHLAWLVGE